VRAVEVRTLLSNPICLFSHLVAQAFAGAAARAPVTVWVKRMDVPGAQYVSVKGVDLLLRARAAQCTTFGIKTGARLEHKGIRPVSNRVLVKEVEGVYDPGSNSRTTEPGSDSSTAW
jgi:hypothetical protein